jgi:hypothetical protein
VHFHQALEADESTDRMVCCKEIIHEDMNLKRMKMKNVTAAQCLLSVVNASPFPQKRFQMTQTVYTNI